MSDAWVVDSSVLFALERAGLAGLLSKLPGKLLVPRAVEEEIRQGKTLALLGKIQVLTLRGRSLKKSRELQRFGINKGEAECCVLAQKLRLGFIVCDDRKFIRQRFFSRDSTLQNIKVGGFSFFLDLLYKNKLIRDVWTYFDKIIKLNNWERSEVYVANYVFLAENGYVKNVRSSKTADTGL